MASLRCCVRIWIFIFEMVFWQCTLSFSSDRLTRVSHIRDDTLSIDGSPYVVDWTDIVADKSRYLFLIRDSLNRIGWRLHALENDTLLCNGVLVDNVHIPSAMFPTAALGIRSFSLAFAQYDSSLRAYSYHALFIPYEDCVRASDMTSVMLWSVESDEILPDGHAIRVLPLANGGFRFFMLQRMANGDGSLYSLTADANGSVDSPPHAPLFTENAVDFAVAAFPGVYDEYAVVTHNSAPQVGNNNIALQFLRGFENMHTAKMNADRNNAKYPRVAVLDNSHVIVTWRDDEAVYAAVSDCWGRQLSRAKLFELECPQNALYACGQYSVAAMAIDSYRFAVVSTAWRASLNLTIYTVSRLDLTISETLQMSTSDKDSDRWEWAPSIAGMGQSLLVGKNSDFREYPSNGISEVVIERYLDQSAVLQQRAIHSNQWERDVTCTALPNGPLESVANFDVRTHPTNPGMYITCGAANGPQVITTAFWVVRNGSVDVLSNTMSMCNFSLSPKSEALACTLDSNGTVYVAVDYTFRLKPHSGSPTMIIDNEGQTDTALIKFGQDGSPLWAVRFGSSFDDTIRSIDMCGSNVVVVGETRMGMAAFMYDLENWPSLNSSGPYFTSVPASIPVGFVAMIDSDGHVVWVQGIAGNYGGSLRSVSCSSDAMKIAISGRYWMDSPSDMLVYLPFNEMPCDWSQYAVESADNAMIMELAPSDGSCLRFESAGPRVVIDAVKMVMSIGGTPDTIAFVGAADTITGSSQASGIFEKIQRPSSFAGAYTSTTTSLFTIAMQDAPLTYDRSLGVYAAGTTYELFASTGFKNNLTIINATDILLAKANYEETAVVHYDQYGKLLEYRHYYSTNGPTKIFALNIMQGASLGRMAGKISASGQLETLSNYCATSPCGFVDKFALTFESMNIFCGISPTRFPILNFSATAMTVVQGELLYPRISGQIALLICEENHTSTISQFNESLTDGKALWNSSDWSLNSGVYSCDFLTYPPGIPSSRRFWATCLYKVNAPLMDVLGNGAGWANDSMDLSIQLRNFDGFLVEFDDMQEQLITAQIVEGLESTTLLGAPIGGWSITGSLPMNDLRLDDWGDYVLNFTTKPSDTSITLQASSPPITLFPNNMKITNTTTPLRSGNELAFSGYIADKYGVHVTSTGFYVQIINVLSSANLDAAFAVFNTSANTFAISNVSSSGSGIGTLTMVIRPVKTSDIAPKQIQKNFKIYASALQWILNTGGCPFNCTAMRSTALDIVQGRIELLDSKSMPVDNFEVQEDVVVTLGNYLCGNTTTSAGRASFNCSATSSGILYARTVSGPPYAEGYFPQVKIYASVMSCPTSLIMRSGSSYCFNVSLFDAQGIRPTAPEVQEFINLTCDSTDVVFPSSLTTSNGTAQVCLQSNKALQATLSIESTPITLDCECANILSLTSATLLDILAPRISLDLSKVHTRPAGDFYATATLLNNDGSVVNQTVLQEVVQFGCSTSCQSISFTQSTNVTSNNGVATLYGINILDSGELNITATAIRAAPFVSNYSLLYVHAANLDIDNGTTTPITVRGRDFFNITIWLQSQQPGVHVTHPLLQETIIDVTGDAMLNDTSQLPASTVNGQLVLSKLFATHLGANSFVVTASYPGLEVITGTRNVVAYSSKLTPPSTITSHRAGTPFNIIFQLSDDFGVPTTDLNLQEGIQLDNTTANLLKGGLSYVTTNNATANFSGYFDQPVANYRANATTTTTFLTRLVSSSNAFNVYAFAIVFHLDAPANASVSNQNLIRAGQLFTTSVVLLDGTASPVAAIAGISLPQEQCNISVENTGYFTVANVSMSFNTSTLSTSAALQIPGIYTLKAIVSNSETTPLQQLIELRVFGSSAIVVQTLPAIMAPNELHIVRLKCVYQGDIPMASATNRTELQESFAVFQVNETTTDTVYTPASILNASSIISAQADSNYTVTLRIGFKDVNGTFQIAIRSLLSQLPLVVYLDPVAVISPTTTTSSTSTSATSSTAVTSTTATSTSSTAAVAASVAGTTAVTSTKTGTSTTLAMSTSTLSMTASASTTATNSGAASSATLSGTATTGSSDQCPDDPLKTAPGECGCGQPDVDTDGDGIYDCHDGCPLDPLKLSPGQCGCGKVDTSTDTDGDGVADCIDGCPTNPFKPSSGVCGCDVACESRFVKSPEECGLPDFDVDSEYCGGCGKVPPGADPRANWTLAETACKAGQLCVGGKCTNLTALLPPPATSTSGGLQESTGSATGGTLQTATGTAHTAESSSGGESHSEIPAHSDDDIAIEESPHASIRFVMSTPNHVITSKDSCGKSTGEDIYVQFAQLLELDSEGNTVTACGMPEFDSETSTSTYGTANVLNANFTATVGEVLIELNFSVSGKRRQLSFGSANFIVGESASKFLLKVRHWPFRSSHNKFALEIWLRSNVDLTLKSTAIDEDALIQVSKLKTPKGQFTVSSPLPAIIDGVEQPMAVLQEWYGDRIMRLVFPSFAELIYDPQFGLLLGLEGENSGKKGECGDDEDNGGFDLTSKYGMIAIGVSVGVVVAGAAVAVGIFERYRRKRKRALNARLAAGLNSSAQSKSTVSPSSGTSTTSNEQTLQCETGAVTEQPAV